MTTQIDQSILATLDTSPPTSDIPADVEAFMGKVAADQTAAYHAVLAYLGDRLGL